MTGHQRRLIIAAAKQAPPVQRNRNDQVGRSEQRFTGAHHVARQQSGDLLTARMLEAQDHGAPLPVIEQGGTGMAPRRRPAPARTAEMRRSAHSLALQRQSAASATGIGDEPDLGETHGA